LRIHSTVRSVYWNGLSIRRKRIGRLLCCREEEEEEEESIDVAGHASHRWHMGNQTTPGKDGKM